MLSIYREESKLLLQKEDVVKRTNEEITATYNATILILN